MVVLAAAVSTKSGRTLISRQFVEMSRSRIEGLLAAFPRMVGTGKEHTFVESENVRYLYQPLEDIFVVVVTNKASNILEDLDTLHMFSRVIPDFCETYLEEDILRNSFELIFAFDEIVSLGYRESINLSNLRTIIEMESHEEKIQEIIVKNKEQDAKEQAKLRMKQMEIQRKETTRHGRFALGGRMSRLPILGSPTSMVSPLAEPITKTIEKDFAAKLPMAAATQVKGLQLGQKPKKNELFEALSEEDGIPLMMSMAPLSKSASTAVTATVSVPRDGVHLLLEERITLIANKDGGLQSMEVKGDLILRIDDTDKSYIRVLTQAKEEHGVQIKTHPNVDRKTFSTDGTIIPKDPSKPFPVNQPINLLRWRVQTTDASEIPLSINCWPSPSEDGSCEVNLEYVLENESNELKNVVISIPVPSGMGAPKITSVEGNYTYDSAHSALLWQVPIIDRSNPSGSLEFKAQTDDIHAFFPINVTFRSDQLLTKIKVLGVKSLHSEDPVKFILDTVCVPEIYQIV